MTDNQNHHTKNEMPEPLRYDSGLHYDTPGLRWDGFQPTTIMPDDNRISAALTPADKAAILAKIAECVALIPFAVNLTPEEKQSLPSIGVERAGMIDAFLEEMQAHPELIPSYVNLSETIKDIALFRNVTPLFSASSGLCERFSDVLKALGADILGNFLPFYANVREARRRNVPGADTVYNRLSPFFARGPRTPSTPPPNP